MAALLEHGPDVDLQDLEGQSPLHRAAINGHLNVVRLLRYFVSHIQHDAV